MDSTSDPTNGQYLKDRPSARIGSRLITDSSKARITV